MLLILAVVMCCYSYDEALLSSYAEFEPCHLVRYLFRLGSVLNHITQPSRHVGLLYVCMHADDC